MQLNTKDTFKPEYAADITKQKKTNALESLLFLKEKRDGTIKYRECADGQKQREGLYKKDSTSPTVYLEYVIITATVDSY